jgi:hypothetical protein
MKKIFVDVDMLLFLFSCQKLHQARYMTPNKRLKITMSAQLCKILNTNFHVMLVLLSNCLPLHCTTTTAVQIAISVQEIMNKSLHVCACMHACRTVCISCINCTVNSWLISVHSLSRKAGIAFSIYSVFFCKFI